MTERTDIPNHCRSLDASEILFLTDMHHEAVAASKAGMRECKPTGVCRLLLVIADTIILRRPGNGDLPADNTFPLAKSFDEIQPSAMETQKQNLVT